MRRRLRLVVGVVGVAVALWGWWPAEAAVGPETAWWSRANGVLPGVSLPAPPDVGEDDLFVAGDGGDERTWQAVAALDVVVPAGRTVGALTLRLSSSPVPAIPATLGLCPLRGSFEPVANGAWADVPAHDCSSLVEGETDDAGETIRFDALAPLVADGHLRVLVVPVGAQRAVVRHPGPDAVALLPLGGSVPSTAPPAAPPPTADLGAVGLPDLPPVSVAPAPTDPEGADGFESAATPDAIPGEAVAAASAGRDWLVGILGLGGLVAICSDLAASRRRTHDRPRGVGHLRAAREGSPAPV